MRVRDSARTAAPAERLLQAIWNEQRLCRENLRTTDGRQLIVLHPGFWNRESGPDFQRAVVQWDNEAPVTVDIEIDAHPRDWQAHRHHVNPAFHNVGLHVVWRADPDAKSGRPVLALEPHLEAPLDQLAPSVAATRGVLPEPLWGRCSAPLGELPGAAARDILRQAGNARLRTKAAQIETRARQAGWEQALWEATLRALGYKHNVWPMQRLAELIAEMRTRPTPAGESGLVAWQSRLLGVANLLPPDIAGLHPQARAYMRTLWDHWWRERDALDHRVLPRAMWRFHGLRPANQPQRRLALAAHWLIRGQFPETIERWFLSAPNSRQPALELVRILNVEEDSFWSWHWSLRSRRLPRPQPLLGAARATGLAANAILPWLGARAAAGQNQALAAQTEKLYLEWPKGEDNALLRLARQRLFGRSAKPALRSAAEQQGLLQILRDFCDHSDAVCTDCSFPELLRAWQAS